MHDFAIIFFCELFAHASRVYLTSIISNGIRNGRRRTTRCSYFSWLLCSKLFFFCARFWLHLLHFGSFSSSFGWRARTFRCREIEYIVTSASSASMSHKEIEWHRCANCELSFVRSFTCSLSFATCACNARVEWCAKSIFPDVYLFCWFAFFHFFPLRLLSLSNKKCYFSVIVNSTEIGRIFFLSLSLLSLVFSHFPFHGRFGFSVCVEQNDQNKYFSFF